MYTEKQFRKCVFNPLSEGRMVDLYPKLSEIVGVDLSFDGNLDKLVRYVICVYDPGSPLVTGERDLNIRKGWGYELAGFNVNDTDFAKTIYTCAYAGLAELIMQYLFRFAKSREYAVLVTIESCYWEAIQHLLSPISGDTSNSILQAVQKKSALKDELDKDLARLDRYQKAFFEGDEIMTEIVKKRSFSSPEKMLQSSNV